MSDADKDKWATGLIAAILLGWMGWLSVTVLTLKERQDSNGVPPAVENSLAEIRTRLNNDQAERAKLTETAIGNAKDIGYLKENLPRRQ